MSRRPTGLLWFTWVAVALPLSARASDQPPRELPGQITPAAVRQVKQATLYLKVTREAGQTFEGSGFLAADSGIAITNAHVLGMLGGKSKTPAKIDVTVHSGEPDEMQTSAKLLGVDRVNDLAVLRVEGNLPAPLRFAPPNELYETQKLYIFGFPLGAQLGKDITVSESSVSSLRKDGRGALERIQTNGGMHAGNSGGPVVNSVGEVIGVSVAAIRTTQINFAIPAATVKATLEGRLLEVKAGELFREDGGVRVPLQCTCLDPLGRIRAVRVESWAGKPAASRPFAPTEPKPEPGDGPRQAAVLKLTNHTASADVSLPETSTGQLVWVQPVLVLADGRSEWGAPRAFDPTLALERTASELTSKLAEQKERTVHLKSSQSLTLTKGKNKLAAAQSAELDILESFAPHAKGALVKTGFGPANLTMEFDGKKAQIGPNIVSALQQIPPTFVVDETNKLRERVSVNLNPRLAPTVREQITDYITQVCNAYEAANFPLPNRPLQPRDTWQVQLPLLLKTGSKPELVDLALTCVYEGIRTRSENAVAVVSFEGRVKGRNANRDQYEGDVVGKFTADVKRGYITSVKMTISSEGSESGSDLFVLFAFDVELTRVEGNPKRIALLPDRPAASATTSKAPDGKTGTTTPDPRTPNLRPADFPFKGLFTKPATSTAPTSYMKIVSTPGDFIGQGKTYEYRGDELVARLTARGVNIMVDGWRLDVAAPKGQYLTVGEYPGAKRAAFSGDSPGLDFSGKGRGSNELSAEFAVWELEIKDGKIVRLAIDFTQRSEGKPKPLTGKVRLNSGFE